MSRSFTMLDEVIRRLVLDRPAQERNMAAKLTCGILGGVFVGGILASVAGHPETLIPVFIAAGAAAAGIWHYLERRD